MYYTKKQQDRYAAIKQCVSDKANRTGTDRLDVLQAEIADAADREAYYWDLMTSLCVSDFLDNLQIKDDWEYHNTRLELLNDLLIEWTA